MTMGDIFLLPRDGAHGSELPPGRPSSKHGLLGMAKQSLVEAGSPAPPPLPSAEYSNMAQRISSMASEVCDSLYARVGQTRAERRLRQLHSQRQQILELRMANVSTDASVLVSRPLLITLCPRPLHMRSGNLQPVCLTSSKNRRHGRLARTATSSTTQTLSCRASKSSRMLRSRPTSAA